MAISTVSSPRPQRIRAGGRFLAGTLRAALDTVLSHPGRPGEIRAASGEFSLEEGVRRYDRIYRKLTAGSAGGGEQPSVGERC